MGVTAMGTVNDGMRSTAFGICYLKEKARFARGRERGAQLWRGIAGHRAHARRPAKRSACRGRVGAEHRNQLPKGWVKSSGLAEYEKASLA